MSTIKYRPEIDGLRAVAVIPVILFHYNNKWMPGGYIGVDVFFVISGFLITSIIMDEYDRSTFSFLNFWLRRIRRILPALITMVLTTLVIGYFFLYAPDINNLGYQGLASLMSFANISHLLVAGNYWGHAAENSPFLHAWSLSVEEQFYLLFPLILFVALKYFHKKTVAIFFVLSLTSVLLFFFGTQTHPSATFYLLPTRAWELGVGALLAIVLSKGYLQLTKKPILAEAGFLAVLLSYFFISGENGISPFLIVPVFGAAFIIAFARDSNTLINIILSAAPVVYIGKISYSLYLWHWPILFFLKQWSLKQNADINSVVAIVVIFLISILSYHFIEVPTRRNKIATPYILTALLVGTVFSYFLKIGDYAEDTSIYSKTEWHGNLYNANPIQESSELVNKRMVGITLSDSDGVDQNTYSSGGIKKLYGGKYPDIVVLGDSHGVMWSKVIDEIASELLQSISFYSADGVPVFFNIPPSQKSMVGNLMSAEEKYIFDKARLEYLAKWKPKVVIIVARWGYIDKEDADDLIRYIGSIGSRVLLIEQPPELFFGDKNTPQYLSYLGFVPQVNSRQYVQNLNSIRYQKGINLVKQLVMENDHSVRVPINDIFLNENKVWVIDSDSILYVDDDHLSYAGSLKAKSRIYEALENIFNGDT